MSLHNCKYQDVTKVLKKLGFKPVRQRGSHVIWEHFSDGRFTVVPNHHGKTIKEGTLRSILSQAEISKNEFLDLLK